MTGSNQHTIPQFYLRSFLEPGYVYRRGAKEPRSVHNPKHVAAREYYYGKVTDDGETLDSLNSRIEDLGAPAFKKLIETPLEITSEDWEVISLVIANMFVRMPANIEDTTKTLTEMADELSEKVNKMKEKFLEAIEAEVDLSGFPTPLPDDDSPSSSVQEVVEEATRMRALGGHRLTAATSFSAIPYIAKIIQQMKFLIVEAPENSFFVTSDRPIVLRDQKKGSSLGVGWASKDVQATIPLHPKKYLFMAHESGPCIGVLPGNSKVVEELNSATMLFANKEIYSPQEYHEAEEWMKG